jgi:uncharacterized membrane protein YfcA
MTLFASIFVLCIIASFIQRTTGFGFGIFIMTMLPFLMPSYAEATTLTGLLAMSNSIYIAIRMRRYVHWQSVVPILCAFVVVSTASIFCLRKIDDVVLRHILGVVLIFFSLYFCFFNKRIRLRPTLPTQIGTGVLSGLMGGFFNMQGPPAVLYFISTTNDKNRYMAMAQIYMLSGNIIMALVRTYNGFMTPTVGIDYLYGIGGVAIGTTLGGRLFDHLSNGIFKYIVYTYIGISGIVVLLTAGR